MWSALVGALWLGAPICADIVLQARVEDDLRHVRGRITCRRVAADAVEIAAYPRVLQSAEAAGLDDVHATWAYPEGFDAAAMRLWHQGRELAQDGPWQLLTDVRPGSDVAVDFETTVPARNGTFGRLGRIAYLLGGWHPTFGRGEAAEPTPLHYRVAVPRATVGVVGSRPFGHASARTQAGRQAGGQVAVLVAPAATVDVDAAAGTVLVVPDDARPGTLRPALGGDAGARREILATLAEGDAFARRLGLDPAPRLVVVAPLREHLVEPFGHNLAISDRAFHTLPLEVLRRFHRGAIWREQLAQAVMPHARTVERTLPPALAADAVGSGLRAMLIAARDGPQEAADDLLEHIAVVPEVDALIFAPQVPLVDAYYDAVDETPPRRVRLDDFDEVLPRGKLLYEKLRDRLGDAATLALCRAYLAGDAELLALVRERGGPAAAETLRYWLGPRPEVDYRIALVDEAALPDGSAEPLSVKEDAGIVAPGLAAAPRDTTADTAVPTTEGRASGASTGPARAPRVAVDIALMGPDAPAVAAAAEPVEVVAVGADGSRTRASRDGPGRLVLDVPAPPRCVELDPRHRLVELAHPPGRGPRFNNRVPPRWRLLLNGFSGMLAVTNMQLSLAAEVGLRRIHDLRFGLDLSASIAPGSLGAQGTGTYHFGREVTPLRLAQAVGLGLAYAKLRPEVGLPVTGHQLSLVAEYVSDDRVTLLHATRGRGLTALLGVGGGLLTDSSAFGYAAAGAGWLRILPLGTTQALALRVRADVMFGNPPPQSRLRLGGRYRGLRGYEIDEARGMQRGIVSVEHRHVLAPQARHDLFGALLLTRLEGAAFADVAYLPNATDGGRPVYFDVGYGLRMWLDIVNLSPTALQLDLGLPLSRGAVARAQRAPVTLYIALVQSFASF